MDLVKSYEYFLKSDGETMLNSKEIFNQILNGTNIKFDEDKIEIRFNENMNRNDKKI